MFLEAEERKRGVVRSASRAGRGGFLAEQEDSTYLTVCVSGVGLGQQCPEARCYTPHPPPPSQLCKECRLSLIYRGGNQSSEKLKHLPKATHPISSLLLPELSLSKLKAFPLMTTPLLTQVPTHMSSERPALTALKCQQVLPVIFIALFCFIFLPNTWNRYTCHLLILNVSFIREGQFPLFTK